MRAIPRSTIEAVASIAYSGKEEKYSFLKSVHYQETSESAPVVLEATTRHYGIRVTTPGLAADVFPTVEGLPTDRAAEAVIPVDTVKTMARNVPKPKRVTHFFLSSVLIAPGRDGTTVLAAPILGNGNGENVTATATKVRNVEEPFPNLDSVIWRADPVFEIDVSPDLLVQVLQAVANAVGTPKNRRSVRLSFLGPKSPIKIEAEYDGTEALGLVMPMTSPPSKKEVR